jgi:hypothetical protein
MFHVVFSNSHILNNINNKSAFVSRGDSVPAFCCCRFFALGAFGFVALVLQLPSVCILSIVFPLVCLIPWWMFQIKVFVVYKKKIKKISV